MGFLSDKLSVEDVQLAARNVFVRVDFNVPIENGKITSVQRIEATLKTINYILKKGPKTVILASHLGRPNGKYVKELSLKPVAEVLQGYINKPVTLLENYLDPEGQAEVKNAGSGKVFLLENLRFHPEEEGSYKDDEGKKVKVSKENIEKFCKALTSFSDVYINDAFGTAHRAHSSIVGVNTETKACGFLMKKELQSFSLVLESPKKPMMMILGGAKLSDKIPLIKNIISKVDYCVIVGGMSYTFLKEYKGKSIGDSLYDETGSKHVHDIIKIAEEKGVKIVLPLDYTIADKFDNNANKKYCKAEDGIPDGWMGLDIGIETIEIISAAMSECATIVWNGPAGVFEMESFSVGTNSLLECMSKLTKNGVTTVIGGGDTASAALKLQKVKELNFTHISTGGGASLELLEGKELPGITILSSK